MMMDDRFYALELLLTAKTGIRDTAVAISETSTPSVRDVLLRQFEEEAQAHQTVFLYTLSRGLTPSYSPEQLIRNDFENAYMALQLPLPALK
ncbi:spore coat protein [Paenibacillus chartarius]|uniref:Spore coat protein n=1 Tax=Paenibacillus chartarius TaxID=747481 RepID=A0ABV6DKH6_9BACL